MKINKETTTPKQQEQQQEQLQEHQQQSPATNGIKQPHFSDTSRASAALSSASLSFIAQKGRQNMCKLLDNVQKGRQTHLYTLRETGTTVRTPPLLTLHSEKSECQ